jgi:hypothetical protein
MSIRLLKRVTACVSSSIEKFFIRQVGIFIRDYSAMIRLLVFVVANNLSIVTFEDFESIKLLFFGRIYFPIFLAPALK